MITIDGSCGEGGGQILRTSLALSMVTGQPFNIVRIRGSRPKPGLQAQHLTGVNAAASICGAEVVGASIGSEELTFSPGKVQPGQYKFAIGTAGSTTLVLQTMLPALLTAREPSTIDLEGGTHNPFAPPFDFLAMTFLPLIARMGPKVEAVLDRHGFYPAGGGRLRANIQPAPKLAPLELTERGGVRHKRARVLIAGLPLDIGAREARVICQRMKLPDTACAIETLEGEFGPGNAVMIEIACDRVVEVFTAFGERGVPAEKVASRAAADALDYLKGGAPVGPYLADQLLLPLAMAGKGVFRTSFITNHTQTNIEVIRRFTRTEIRIARCEGSTWLVRVG